jgi:dipeptidyl aminopeptidase/acylaminoacyl peptidase
VTAELLGRHRLDQLFDDETRPLSIRSQNKIAYSMNSRKRISMTHFCKVEVGLILLTAFVSACGDSTSPPTTGTLEFNIQTTGTDIDADGFLVDVDGQSRVLPANGILSVSALPGAHPLDISGLAFNCDLITAPASSSVTLGKSTRVDVQATCTPYLQNTILYISEELGGAVVAMRPDGSRRVQLTTDHLVYAAPAVSPDGQSFAVASGSFDGIYVFDRFGHGGTKLAGRASFDGTPAWSPDGTKLAFRSTVPSSCGDIGRIFVVNRDGTGLRQLTPGPATNECGFDDYANWSPDSKRLLFMRSGVLMFINADGTGLDSTAVNGGAPAWSNDGTRIAFESMGGGGDGILVMDMTFVPRRITTPLVADQHPRWSPDDSRLVFERVEGGVFQIYTMRPDGSAVTKISASSLSDSWATWSPN